MNIDYLQEAINKAWEGRDLVTPETEGEVRDAVQESLEGLDAGVYRVAE